MRRSIRQADWANYTGSSEEGTPRGDCAQRWGKASAERYVTLPLVDTKVEPANEAGPAPISKIVWSSLGSVPVTPPLAVPRPPTVTPTLAVPQTYVYGKNHEFGFTRSIPVERIGKPSMAPSLKAGPPPVPVRLTPRRADGFSQCQPDHSPRV